MATLHAFLLLTSFSLSDCSSTRDGICQRAHTHYRNTGPRPIRGGVRPSLSLIGLDQDISLTGVSFVEFLSRGYFFFFSFLEWLDAPVRPGIFVSRTREKLGRTLEPCSVIRTSHKRAQILHWVKIFFLFLKARQSKFIYIAHFINSSNSKCFT